MKEVIDRIGVIADPVEGSLVSDVTNDQLDLVAPSADLRAFKITNQDPDSVAFGEEAFDQSGPDVTCRAEHQTSHLLILRPARSARSAGRQHQHNVYAKCANLSRSRSAPEFGWRPGLRAGIGLSLAVFPVAVSFGALATTLGWPPLASVICSAVVFSAGGQLALLTTLTGGSGVVLALGAATLINLRFLPMGVAVAGSLPGPAWKRALAGQTILDGSWAAAYQGAGRYDRLTMFGASAVQWPAWILGTVVGVVAAPPPDLVESLGLDLVFPGFFLVLLLDSFRSTPRAPWIAGTAVLLTGGLVLVAPTGVAVLLSALAASVVLVGRGGPGPDRPGVVEPA